MNEYARLDFDGDALKLVRTAYTLAKNYMEPRVTKWKRFHKIYNAVIDMTNRDPDRANIFIPKILQIVKFKIPRDVRAVVGTHPYIPFTSRNPEFKIAMRPWETYGDILMDTGGYYGQVRLGVPVKCVYGLAYLEATPYFEPQTVMMPQDTPYGIQVLPKQIWHLRMDYRARAPWEVYVDPHATGLESRRTCRYVVKFDVVSKRQIIEYYQRGGYPGLDIAKLQEPGNRHFADDWGQQMLSDMGLPEPDKDDDIGIVLRYESPDRYIDIWNGNIVLRDIPNPFKHGLINLSRWIHDIDAHTKNGFFGKGEVEDNEVQQDLLNDMGNRGIDSYNIAGQPVIYYRKQAVEPSDLLYSMGNRIPVGGDVNYPIEHYIKESFGTELPMTHWQFLKWIEEHMDYVSGQSPVSRGEISEDDPTATEIVKADERGSDRQELSVRDGEEIFLNDFSKKHISNVAQFARPFDLQIALGRMQAFLATLVKPDEVPGGLAFQFKGSARVANLLIKQRNFATLKEIFFGNPQVMQGLFLQWALETFEEDTPEHERMIIPDQIFMQMQARAAEIEMRGQPGARPRPAGNKQIAQDTARNSRRAAS